ncbi:VanZ family protein [Nocardioides sp. Y6]|uniref:VanZ family protein n=1 Tax=Nocardioides malaquae TaxID=2773426 RepID=A0ABR9RTF0_9ACTN|nr:VanZ family protein [Nocardioides malaquae]MBE7324839.1 VanZ family protein [Nocardioides malaquae]
MKSPWTVAARVVLLAYVIFLAWVLLRPTPEHASSVVGRVTEELLAAGAPEVLVAGARVEFGLNALMFAPLPFLGALAFPRVGWGEWVAWAFIGSMAAELYQGALLPGRSAQFVDIVANTLGGLIGSLAAIPLKWMTGAYRRPRDRHGVEHQSLRH